MQSTEFYTALMLDAQQEFVPTPGSVWLISATTSQEAWPAKVLLFADLQGPTVRAKFTSGSRVIVIACARSRVLVAVAHTVGWVSLGTSGGLKWQPLK
jgi:hypothetical protein